MLYIIIGVVILAFYALFAHLMKQSAAEKGYGGEYHIWAICFWGSLFGYLYVLSLPDLIARQQREDILEVLLAIRQQEDK